MHPIGRQRRALSTSLLPFNEVQVWFKVQVQNTEFDDLSIVVSAQTLLCSPLYETWSFRQYNTTIFNVDPVFRWPENGLKGLCTICTIYPILPPLTGHHICQLQLILCSLRCRGMDWPWIDWFLIYVHWFNVVGQDAAQLKIRWVTQPPLSMVIFVFSEERIVPRRVEP